MQAVCVCGHIKGNVSCASSDRNHKFEMEPELKEKFAGIDLMKEVQRLYFELETK